MIDNAKIVSKSIELSKAFINTSPGMHSYDLKVSREIGHLARFATTIHGAQVIENEEQLAAFSSAMKIDYRIVPNTIINVLDDLDWIDIVKEGSSIKKILEKVPPVEDIIRTLGQEWQKRSPSNIDSTSVKSLDLLCERPYELTAIESELNLDRNEFHTLFDYGKQANYLGAFKSKETEKDVIYTIYWQGKSAEVEKFSSKRTESQYVQLFNIYTQVKKHQGIPVENVMQGNLVQAGIYYGFFPAVSLKNRRGQQFQYAFTASPHFDHDPNRDIFERARMIVA